MRSKEIKTVIGVDYSGAALAGKNAWLAELAVASDNRLKLLRLDCVGKLAGNDERAATNRYLIDRISRSNETLFGFDFPFGLPIELGLGSWKQQLRHVGKFRGGARDYGRELVKLSRSRLDVLHVRRQTDSESRTPFDCYHYRIIYQTFHGMRDVLSPVAAQRETAVLPFQYMKISAARRCVCESCPSSTLKRMSLPSQLYKQTGSDTLSDDRKKVRRKMLSGMAAHVEIPTRFRRTMMRNLGGDALDAVIAAVGTWTSWMNVDHEHIARDKRYPREGYVYH